MAGAFIKRGKSADLAGSDSNSPDYEFVSVLDERGRIIVPAFLRKRLSLGFGSKVLVSVKTANEMFKSMKNQEIKMKPEEVKLDFSKLNGLIPAVAQDWKTKEVLMLAFMNEEAWRRL